MISARIADKYISEGGRTAAYGKAEFCNDLMVAAEFLIWAEEDFYAGHTGKDAYCAMMRLLDMDPIKLRKIIKGDL